MENVKRIVSALALLAGSGAAGCAVPGQRAGGGCPDGEVCSPDTPNGLYFYGASFGDEIFGGGPGPTAAGGRQTIEVVLNDTGVAFNLPFDADGTGQIAVDAVIRPDVAVRGGGAAGTGMLRIIDRDDGTLYDRIGLSVDVVQRTELAPLGLAFWYAPPTQGWAAFRGAQVPVIVRLYGGADERLVDENLSLAAVDATANQTRWDGYVVSTTADLLSGAVVTGGVSVPFTDVPVVDTIDAVEIAGQADMVPMVNAGSAYNFCFFGENTGRLVAGAPWSFASDDGLGLESSGDECVTITPPAAGTYTLTVHAADYTKDYTVTALPATMSTPAPAAPTLRRASTPRNARGERAVVVAGF